VPLALGVVSLTCSPAETDAGAADFAVTPESFSLPRRDTLRLHTVAVDQFGDTLTGIPVLFHSNDTAIATVDAFGLVRAGANLGSTSITAVLTRSTLQKTANVSVFAVPGVFTLSPTDTFLFQGGAVQLAATARDTGGIPIPGAAVTYTTTGPIAVNGTALVTSLGPAGEASVTGRFDPYILTSRIHVLDTALAGNRVSAVGHAAAAAVSRSGIALVTRTLAVFLTRINLPSLASSQFRVPLGLSAVVFDTTGAHAYALDPSGKVQIIDVATNVAADSFTTTGTPTAEVVTADNLQILVASSVDSVVRYGRASLARLGAFAVPASVTAMVRHPMNAALIYLALPDSGLVLEYDLAGDSIRRRLPLGAAPARLAVAVDGSELYASDRSAATVQVWDLTANTAVTTIPVGVAAADIAVSPNGARIWVSARTQGQVKEIDKATRAIVRIITTSGAPRGVAISPLDGTAVVANDSGWVDVIKP
jgi:DNA-binding beta-propeller fold protein YncE